MPARLRRILSHNIRICYLSIGYVDVPARHIAAALTRLLRIAPLLCRHDAARTYASVRPDRWSEAGRANGRDSVSPVLHAPTTLLIPNCLTHQSFAEPRFTHHGRRQKGPSDCLAVDFVCARIDAIAVEYRRRRWKGTGLHHVKAGLSPPRTIGCLLCRDWTWLRSGRHSSGAGFRA